MSWTFVGHLLEHQPQCWLSSTLMWKCLIYIQSLQWQSFQRRMIWHLMMTLNSCVSMHVIYEPCKWLLTSWSVANVVVFHPEWAEYYAIIIISKVTIIVPRWCLGFIFCQDILLATEQCTAWLQTASDAVLWQFGSYYLTEYSGQKVVCHIQISMK